MAENNDSFEESPLEKIKEAIAESLEGNEKIRILSRPEVVNKDTNKLHNLKRVLTQSITQLNRDLEVARRGPVIMESLDDGVLLYNFNGKTITVELKVGYEANINKSKLYVSLYDRMFTAFTYSAGAIDDKRVEGVDYSFDLNEELEYCWSAEGQFFSNTQVVDQILMWINSGQ